MHVLEFQYQHALRLCTVHQATCIAEVLMLLGPMCCVFLQLLVDPVCMLTCCPKLLHSFVYKVPRLNAQLLTPLGLMDVARYVCSRDLIIAEVLHRHAVPCLVALYHALPCICCALSSVSAAVEREPRVCNLWQANKTDCLYHSWQ